MVKKDKEVLFIIFSAFLIPRHQLMVRTLNDNGYKVTVISWVRNRRADTENTPSYVYKWHSVNLKAGIGSASLLLKLPGLYQSIFNIVKQKYFQFVFLGHFFLLPVGMLLDKKSKIIYDSTEFFCKDLAAYFHPVSNLAEPFIKAFEKNFVKRTHGILTIDSKDNWFAHYYQSMHQNVQVLWNVPSIQDDPIPKEIEPFIQQYAGRQVVAYVGGLKHSKGLEVIIRAANHVRSRIPEVFFLLIGPWQQDKSLIQSLIKDFELEEYIQFVNPKSYRQMLAHIKCSKLGLAVHQNKQAYQYLGLGNGRKFFTYMQANIPIIAPSFGDLGKIVEDNGCGIRVDTESVQKVSSAILFLLLNPQIAGEYANSGRSAFENKVNWEIESEKFVSFIELF